MSELYEDRHEADGWTINGEKITSPGKLEAIRKAADDGAGIVVQHWHYRGSGGPHIRGFVDFDDFEEYVADQAHPGDHVFVWSFSRVCNKENVLAEGKVPDVDGCVPSGGAY